MVLLPFDELKTLFEKTRRCFGKSVTKKNLIEETTFPGKRNDNTQANQIF